MNVTTDLLATRFDPELSAGARNAIRVCLSVKADERVVILTDRESAEIGAALAAECDGVALATECFVIEEFGPRQRARSISRGEARCRILDRYIHNVIASPLATTARLFGWKLNEAKQAAEVLVAQGQLEIDVKITGLRELQLVAKDFSPGQP